MPKSFNIKRNYNKQMCLMGKAKQLNIFVTFFLMILNFNAVRVDFLEFKKKKKLQKEIVSKKRLATQN